MSPDRILPPRFRFLQRRHLESFAECVKPAALTQVHVWRSGLFKPNLTGASSQIKVFGLSCHVVHQLVWMSRLNCCWSKWQRFRHTWPRTFRWCHRSVVQNKMNQEKQWCSPFTASFLVPLKSSPPSYNGTLVHAALFNIKTWLFFVHQLLRRHMKTKNTTAQLLIKCTMTVKVQ